MDQENQNQPPPVETENQSRPADVEGGAPDQNRRRRSRRRYPRRRFYDRDRGPGNENQGPRDYEQNGPSGEGYEAAPGEGENGEQSQGEPELGEGIIEISGKGFGFLRDPKRNFVQTPQDIL